MGTMASQITSLTIVYLTDYSDADQRKHHSSASLAFVREINQGLVNSPHKWPVTRKMFPFDDVIMPQFIFFTSAVRHEIPRIWKAQNDDLAHFGYNKLRLPTRVPYTINELTNSLQTGDG